MQTTALTRALLYAFQNAAVASWEAIAAEDVLINTPAGFAIRGRPALTSWSITLARALGFAIDLVDEHLALDQEGNGRGFVTLKLRWKPNLEFIQAPDRNSGWESSESLLLTIKEYRFIRIYVAGDTLDLALRAMPAGAVLDDARAR
jgi:hypothetical protein